VGGLMESKLIKVTGPSGERKAGEHHQAPSWVKRLKDAGGDALRGFRVEARDGQAGKIEQVLYWSDAGKPDYVVVSDGKWLFGRKAVLSVQTIEDIDVDNRRLRIGLSREEIRRAPEFLPWT
jgi:hypothetical protein